MILRMFFEEVASRAVFLTFLIENSIDSISIVLIWSKLMQMRYEMQMRNERINEIESLMQQLDKSRNNEILNEFSKW